MKPTTPLERVRAFLAQHATMDSGDRSQIARVAIEGQPPAPLYAADLRFIVETVDRLRDLAYRGSGGGSPELMAEMFGLAAGLAPGVPLPPVGRPPESVVTGETGAVMRAITGSDPFAAGGGGTRTRTCVHCLRRCGDAPGGAAVIDGLPVCYPNDLSRPNCYDQILAGHPARNCEECHGVSPELFETVQDAYGGPSVGQSRHADTPMPPSRTLGRTPLEQLGRSVGKIRIGHTSTGRPPRKLGGPFGE